MIKLSIDLPKGFLDEEAKTLIVPRHRKEVWAVELDLLAQLDRVCRKHGIRYFCDGGTVLGAVRHGGFIPWDDDIDVIMSRAEYEKLNAVASSEFQHPYFWQTNATDPGFPRGHTQLRNSQTTAIMKVESHEGKPLFRFNQGIFIDIFPFDNIPDDAAERKKFLHGIDRWKRRINIIEFCHVFASRGMRVSFPRKAVSAMVAIGIRAWEKFTGRNAVCEACEALTRVAKKYQGVATREVAPVSYNPHHREVLPACFLEEAVEIDFEFMKIPVMAHYLESIEINYGKNWREHVIGASNHEGMLVDTRKPYLEYFDL